MLRTIVLIMAVTTLLSGTLALQGWVRRQQARWVISYAILTTAIFVWSFGYTLELALFGLQQKIFWAKVQYIGISVLPIGWFLFALRYGGYEKFVTLKTRLLLVPIPAFTVLLAFTNESHHWLWANLAISSEHGFPVLVVTQGFWFWVNWFVAQLLVFTGTVIMILSFRNLHAQHWGNLGLLVGAALIPWGANLIYLLGLSPIKGLDWTPFAFAISGTLLSFSIFRLNFLDLLPVARQTAVHNLPDGMIILDKRGKLVDINPAAKAMLHIDNANLIGTNLERHHEQFPILAQLSQSLKHTNRQGQTEIAVDDTYYAVQKSDIFDQQHHLRGSIITLRDITIHKQSEATLAAQMRLFESMFAVAQATHGDLSSDTLLSKAVEVALSLVYAEEGSLITLDEQGKVRNYLLAKESTVKARQFTQKVIEEGTAGWVYRHQKPALIHNTQSDSRWLWHPDEKRNPRSALVIPITSGTQVVGILSLHHSQPNYFKEQDAQLMQAAANQMALAIRNSELFEAQRRSAQDHLFLYRILQELSSNLDIKTVLKTAVKSISAHKDWSTVAIIEPNSDQTVFRVTAASGINTFQSGKFNPLAQKTIELAYHSGNTHQVAIPHDGGANTPDDAGGDAMAASPIEFRGEQMGVLAVQSMDRLSFNVEDIWLIDALADACGLAMANARLLSQTRQQLREQTMLQNAVTSIVKNIELTAVLQGITEHICQILDATSIFIGEYDAAKSSVQVLSRHFSTQANPAETQIQKEYLLQFGHQPPLTHKADPVVVHPARQPENTAHQSLSDAGIRTIVRIPLPVQTNNDTKVYVEVWDSRKQRQYGDAQLDVATAIAQHATVALNNARLFQSIATERLRFKSLIDTIRDGVILFDDKHTILVINQKAVDLLELGGQAAVWHQLHLADLVVSAEAFVTAVTSPQAKSNHTTSWSGELELGSHYLHWRKMPVNIDSDVNGFFIVIRDITEERLLEQLRDDLIHMMVHDMRNPLNTINLSLDLLARFIPPDAHGQTRQILARSKESTTRTLHLVNSILDIHQLESSRMPLEFVSFDLAQVIQEVIEMQQPLADEKSITMNTLIAAETAVFADRAIISRVLQNLVSNALKFTRNNGKITVHSHLDTNKNSLIIFVSDTGTGIPTEIQTRLFQRFVTGRQEERGNGLGLAFCRLALENHQQRIWLEKSTSSGTTIAFSLPLASDYLPQLA